MVSSFAGLIPIKREVVLAVLLGFSIGWWQSFAAMAVIVSLLAFLEWKGKAMMYRLAWPPTTSPW
ncbi:MAG: hypothetical protein EOP83_30350 [Verrucomicrobiaceae bacterium]|nr:MAG: hypothetical protein EOP83_30350 [Verrucomicrobiaceae bacterium]